MAESNDSQNDSPRWQDYEKAARDIYEAILRREGSNAEVRHNVNVQGRSGVAHQVDVYWKFRQAGLEHAVIIDCKDFARPISLEKVRNWFGVKSDVPNAHAVLVTREGYQSGAADFARSYGISLKLLRHPTEEDWEGRIRDLDFIIEGKLIDPDSVQIEMAFDFKAFDLTNQSDIDRARRIYELLQSETLVRTRLADACLENSAGEILNNERI